MDLIDMKNTSEDLRDQPVIATHNPYPSNLKICLYEEQIEKLGFDAEIESEIVFIAKAKVCSTSKREEEGGKVYRTADLQITEMKIKGEKGPEETLYGNRQ